MARFVFGPARATTVQVGGQSYRAVPCGDPRRHDAWINHTHYKGVLQGLDELKEGVCQGWEIVLPVSQRPWLVIRVRHSVMIQGLSRHRWGPARPWMLLPPAGESGEVHIYPSLTAAVEAIVNPPEERARGRLGRFADHGDDEVAFTGIQV